MAGFSARYVSGYLAPDAGEASAAASHAWFQVLAGDAWLGFDPANGVPQDERYVVTAVGRDYDDIPPLRGTYTGVAEEEWSTSVRVRTQTQ
jgi:transglutaminase-like putative cysteine protease